MNEQIWWYLARATGLTAWGLATAAVLWGVLLHSKLLGKKVRNPWLLDLHRHLGGLTLLFTLAHMGSLVADSYIHFGWADLFIPFAASWHPAGVAAGVVAFWLLLAVEVTSLAMKRLPKKLWRTVHASSFAMFVLSTGHGVAAGTDFGNPLFLAGLFIGLVAMVFAATYRFLATRPGSRARCGASNKQLVSDPSLRRLDRRSVNN